MGATRIERITAALQARFDDARIEVEDESHLHAGHAGAATGRGHFRLRIVSTAFAGLAPIARHRAVYDALGDLMQTDIHALSIDARTP
ncbi:MAG: cell division protein BolA [Panacagrimonas sp.]|nr:BolA family protein [Panacagrimonas sp.]MCC2657276.1 cell division protein BolA [Panacagrimonas sp.]